MNEATMATEVAETKKKKAVEGCGMVFDSAACQLACNTPVKTHFCRHDVGLVNCPERQMARLKERQ